MNWLLVGAYYRVGEISGLFKEQGLSEGVSEVENAVSTTANETSDVFQSLLLQMDIKSTQNLLAKIICIIIVTLIAIVILKITERVLNKFILKSDGGKLSSSQVTTAHVIHSIFRFVLIALVIIIALDILGVNVTGFVAGLGIVGAIAALAVQDLIKDIIAGTNIVSEQYFSIGDFVECKGYTGTIISLSMKSTKIKTPDGSIVTLQNHLIDEARKLSSENRINVPMPYDYERKSAFALMEHIAKEVEKLPEVSKARFADIDEFGDSSIEYALLFNCDPALKMAVKRKVNVVIINELDKAGVEIPFSQLDIHQK